MAGKQHSIKTPITKAQFLLTIPLVLMSACVGRLNPPLETVDPGQRTARLEETYRIHAYYERDAQADKVAHLVSKSLPAGREINRIAFLVADAALEHKLDPLLVASLIMVESGYQQQIVSSAGAVGLMQVLPYVGRDVAQRNRIVWSGDNALNDAETNIAVGTAYLRELIDTFDGDLELALAAYNMGPTLLKKKMATGWRPNGPYVRKVLAHYKRLRSAPEHLQPTDTIHLTAG